jgi:hypothetical protein
MAINLDRLEQLLEAESQGYLAFVTRLPLKQALIRRGQTTALQAFLAREADDQGKLRKLELERTAMARAVAYELGLPPEAPLLQIIDRVPPDRRTRLASLRESLMERANRLREGNALCELLLGASLEFVKYSMELIAGILNPEERLADMIYGPDETGSTRSGSVLLNRTA